MKNLKIKIYISMVFFLVAIPLVAQIKVSEILQESKIVETESNKLYFVDFWATWCGPCVYAKEMLTILQKQYPNDFYVVSISDESADKVKQYLKKKPTELAIAVDEDGITFKEYKIFSRPNGILFNAKGEKLWQGHPSDLKPYLLDRFLRENRTKESLNKFLKVIKTKEFLTEDYIPKDNIEIKLSENSTEELTIFYGNSYLNLDGGLQDIISYLSKINKKQIQISTSLNKRYKIYIKNSELKKDNIDIEVLNKFGLQVTENSTMGEVISLHVNNPNFWDTTQINWGDTASKYLVSDSDISADNVSLRDMAYQLSIALEIPVVISSSNINHLYSIHDWQMHYKYFEFMQTNFEEYGIKVKKEVINYPLYNITKKAP